ncbi:IclR family transcriptional regulator [Streptomyces sp. NPDC087844]|uniref:IclR family transcriptional regulator n=1 Tax=Streptomyces sp. NPDC087844 TaxID=3365805 RepID=UPI00380DE2C8
MLSGVGGTIPAHCSGLGRAILAWSDVSAFDAVVSEGLRQRTPRTITSPDALRRELDAIPGRGLAFDEEEGNPGVNCIAAPIFDGRGNVVAALSVTGHTATVRPHHMGPAVRMAAAAASRAYSSRRWEVSRRLGGLRSQ